MELALREFETRTQQLLADIQFLERSFELRPRIFEVLNYQGTGDMVKIATEFGSSSGADPALFCGPLLVRLIGSFERFLRMTLRDAIDAWSKKAKTFSELPDGISDRNLVLTGRLLSSIDTPRDHLKFDVISLIDNLVTCRDAGGSYQLNSLAFMDLVSGITPEVVEKGLRAVRIPQWENAVAADRKLQAILGQTRTVDTAKEMMLRLKKLSRWRNNWAHGGDEEVSLTFRELREQLEFLIAFARAMDAVVSSQIQSARLS
jgi:RiboL-PSP-HEPN